MNINKISKLILLFFLFGITNKMQSSELDYQNSFLEISNMLLNVKPLDFRHTVFITENAYLDNQLNEKEFNDAIRFNTAVL